ncbi:hypothetical protein [Okeania sp. KiyG1]|uniref:hypothetical protein n=1 Tax=Okeania sp. KiyG1 TaxID=2720165 RepID=UPI001922F22E|nr:hypothetical protein [Okeania sp. KiyG1]GGA19313.1 hypothetical protein CYANOKiyG1_33890 [Okeania sp. KiyG1]
MAILSVLIEPLLMAVVALAIALVTATQESLILQFLCLVIILSGFHPIILNPVIKLLEKLKLKTIKPYSSRPLELKLKGYPIKPFFGEICFVIIRGSGFLLTILALNSIELNQVL